MITHVVLLKWKDGVDRGAVETAKAEIRALKGQIPGLLDVTAGDNFSSRSQGYDFGAVMRFADRASLDAYGPHPLHQRVVTDRLRPILADILVVDYEA